MSSSLACLLSAGIIIVDFSTSPWTAARILSLSNVACVPWFISRPTVDGYQGCLQFGPLANKVAMTVCVQVLHSFGGSAGSRQLSEGGISKVTDKLVSNVLAPFCIPPAVYEGSTSSHPLPPLASSIFSLPAILIGV